MALDAHNRHYWCKQWLWSGELGKSSGKSFQNLRMHGGMVMYPGMPNPDLDTLKNALSDPMNYLDPMKRSEIVNMLKQHDPAKRSKIENTLKQHDSIQKSIARCFELVEHVENLKKALNNPEISIDKPTREKIMEILNKLK